MIRHDDRPRPEDRSTPAAGSRRASRRWRLVERAHRAYRPAAAGRASTLQARRDPRPCRPRRLRPHRACPRACSASTGARRRDLRIDGKAVTIASPQDAIGRGLYPGAGGPQAVRPASSTSRSAENISLADLATHRRAHAGRPQRPKTRGAPSADSARLDIRAPTSTSTPARCRAATSRRWCWRKWLSMRPQRA